MDLDSAHSGSSAFLVPHAGQAAVSLHSKAGLIAYIRSVDPSRLRRVVGPQAINFERLSSSPIDVAVIDARRSDAVASELARCSIPFHLIRSHQAIDTLLMENVGWTFGAKTGFRTSNLSLFDSGYFPIELAQSGSGKHLDANILEFLTRIGVISPVTSVVRIIDGGGWDTVSNWEACIKVVIHDGAGQKVFAICGSPLLQPLSVQLPQYQAWVTNNLAILRHCRISHDTVCIHKGTAIKCGGGVPKSVEHCLKRRRLVRLIDQFARIAAFVDSGLPHMLQSVWDRFHGPTVPIRPVKAVGGEIVEREGPLSLASALTVYGDDLVWTDAEVMFGSLSFGLLELHSLLVKCHCRHHLGRAVRIYRHSSAEAERLKSRLTNHDSHAIRPICSA